jgi:hypothetical protein
VGLQPPALIEAGAWTLDLEAAWGIVLVGVAVALVIEWRTVGQHKSSTA